MDEVRSGWVIEVDPLKLVLIEDNYENFLTTNKR